MQRNIKQAKYQKQIYTGIKPFISHQYLNQKSFKLYQKQKQKQKQKHQQQQDDKQTKDRYKQQLLTSNTQQHDLKILKKQNRLFMKHKKTKTKYQIKNHQSVQIININNNNIDQESICEWQTSSTNKFFEKKQNISILNNISQETNEQITKTGSEILSTLKKYKPLVSRSPYQIKKNQTQNFIGSSHLNHWNLQEPTQEQLSNKYRYTFLKNHISNQAIIIKNKDDALDQQKQNSLIRRNKQLKKAKQVSLSLNIPIVEKSQQRLPSIHNINKVYLAYQNQSQKLKLKSKERQSSFSYQNNKNLQYAQQDNCYNKNQSIQSLFNQRKNKHYSYRQYNSPLRLQQQAIRLKLMKRKQRLYQLGKKQTRLNQQLIK